MLGISRSHIQKLCDKGFVTCNGVSVKKRHILSLNDTVVVSDFDIPPQHLIKENIPIDILYEDDYIAIINKPQGIVVHPGAGNHTGTLANALCYHFNMAAFGKESLRPGIVHRLDKETSGVMVIAKTVEAFEHLSLQFEKREVYKKYIAFSAKKPTKMCISTFISRHPKDRTKMCVSESGKLATTSFEIMRETPHFYVIKAEPETGRTHQIRVHLAALNAPILGDTTYGGEKRFNAFRQMLHASCISFKHPESQKTMHFSAPLSDDMQSILDLRGITL